MRTAQRRQQPIRFVHWVGFLMVAGSFALVLMGGEPGPAFGVTGTILIITAVYHAVRGSSWLQVLTAWFSQSPILLGFLTGAAFFTIGWVIPSPAPESVVPQPAAETAPMLPVASVSAETPTPTPTPSQSPSLRVSPSPSPSPAASVSAAVSTPSAAVSPSAEASPASGQAAVLLSELAIKGRAPKTGYSRDEFGQRWADVDRNGCDTRNDILGRDLTSITYKAGTRDCVVLTGDLGDPFTGSLISFVRGNDTSRLVQIDHVLSVPAR